MSLKVNDINHAVSTLRSRKSSLCGERKPEDTTDWFCLPAETLIALTGRMRPSAQSRVLKSLGIPYRRRPDNTLIVLRAHVEAVAGGKGTMHAEPQLVL